MRAMKRTVSVVLALVMVLGMMTMAISVSAAGTNTITAKSNIANSYSVNYGANTKQVTVTYTFKTAKKLVNAEGVATYDSSVLTLSEATLPGFNNANVQINTEAAGTIEFNASNPNGYDFSDGAVMAKFVFNIVGTGNTTVDLQMAQITATKATELPASEENDVNVINDGQNAGEAYTSVANAVVDVPVEVNVKDYFKSQSLNLRGKVGINFNCLIPAEYTGRECKVVLSSDVGDDVTTILGPDNYVAANNYYVCTYNVRSIDLTRTITAKYYVDGAFVCEKEYSAKKYIDSWITAYPSDTNKTTALLKALAYYGAKAQIYFKTQGVDTNDSYLANQGIDYTAPTVNASDITATNETVPTLTDIGISKGTMNLTLDADTSVNVACTVSDWAKVNAANVTVDGSDRLTYTKDTSNRAVFSKADVASNAYAKDYTFNFGNGKTFKASVHTYLKKALSNNISAEFRALCEGVYAYGNAAVASFGAEK